MFSSGYMPRSGIVGSYRACFYKRPARLPCLRSRLANPTEHWPADAAPGATVRSSLWGQIWHCHPAAGLCPLLHAASHTPVPRPAGPRAGRDPDCGRGGRAGGCLTGLHCGLAGSGPGGRERPSPPQAQPCAVADQRRPQPHTQGAPPTQPTASPPAQLLPGPGGQRRVLWLLKLTAAPVQRTTGGGLGGGRGNNQRFLCIAG